MAVFRFPWVPPDSFSPQWAQTVQQKTGRRDGFATYLHASDAALAYALAIESPRGGFDAYHFSAADVLSFEPLAEQLEKHWPGAPRLPADWPKFKSPMLNNKAREHFGWEPAWSFHDQYRSHYGSDQGS